MFASAIIPLALIGILLVFLVLTVRHFVIRAEILRAISSRKVDDATMAAISKALVAINEQCSTYMFNADRAATFLFRWLMPNGDDTT